MKSFCLISLQNWFQTVWSIVWFLINLFSIIQHIRPSIAFNLLKHRNRFSWSILKNWYLQSYAVVELNDRTVKQRSLRNVRNPTTPSQYPPPSSSVAPPPPMKLFFMWKLSHKPLRQAEISGSHWLWSFLTLFCPSQFHTVHHRWPSLQRLTNCTVQASSKCL